MSILIYMLLAYWQAKHPAPELPAPPPPAGCASVIIRNRNASDLWTVCTVEQFQQRIHSVNPDFLAGKSDIIYKSGQAPTPPPQQKPR